MNTTLRWPDGRPIIIPPFIQSPEQVAERDAILRGEFFLVRQGTLGELFKCTRCNRKHVYLSLMCIERPFSGVTGGLWAFFKAFGDPQTVARMQPAERRRMAQLRQLIDDDQVIPDLSTSHPQLARSIHVGERDAQIGAVALGVLEPIPPTLARRLQSRINAAGIKPPLELPGLEGD